MMKAAENIEQNERAFIGTSEEGRMMNHVNKKKSMIIGYYI